MCNYGGKKKGFDLTSQMDLERVSSILGEGPYRFAPPEPERKLQQQLDSLSVEEKECVDALIDKWDANHPADPLPDELVLRSARNSHEPFHKKQAWNAMKVIQRPKTMGYLSLSAVKMEKQLSTGTLFPLPGMNTKNNHEVLYMKPSRYVPSETPTKAVLNNLAYCMNSMYEKESTSRDGIAFLANMDDWTMNKHFATEYCLKFMNMLQGKTIPVRVNLFLIVNPKPWFNKVWNIMRPMLSDEFAKKVFMIPETQLAEHLMEGYEKFLPDEMTTSSGQMSTQKVVSDYIQYCTFLETGRVPMSSHFDRVQTKKTSTRAPAKRIWFPKRGHSSPF